ncbi:MAG: Membrane protein involved in colicin uptake [Candidatus Saccharibacteria bacterium]|nr:Membrane protein involved in colicin uptake [Candidatus Saccharibacteria bacterium]
MTEQVQQVKQVDPDGSASVRTTTVADENVTREEPKSSIAARVVWFIAGILITLLAFRFVLILLGANRGNTFVDLIYTLSYPFAAPFFGIFGYDLRYGVSRTELSTLVAIAVYALVAYGIARLLTIKQPN